MNTRPGDDADTKHNQGISDMTARPQDVAPLPLPEPFSHVYSGGMVQTRIPVYSREQVNAITRANLSAALASAQAREEELRAECTRLKVAVLDLEKERSDLIGDNERLAEALRFLRNNTSVNSNQIVSSTMPSPPTPRNRERRMADKLTLAERLEHRAMTFDAEAEILERAGHSRNTPDNNAALLREAAAVLRAVEGAQPIWVDSRPLAKMQAGTRAVTATLYAYKPAHRYGRKSFRLVPLDAAGSAEGRG